MTPERALVIGILVLVFLAILFALFGGEGINLGRD